MNNLLNEILLGVSGRLGANAEVRFFSGALDQLKNDNTFFLQRVVNAKRNDSRHTDPDLSYQTNLEGFITDWKKVFDKLVLVYDFAEGDNLSKARADFSKDILPVIKRMQRNAITGSLELEKKMARDASLNHREFRANQRAVVTASFA
ncbi:MAG: hypothetical protein GY947_16020, partial [Rhodobacteraceae bacterium]|nr:hypothetical protein [Paracoccaceae bacterium]